MTQTFDSGGFFTFLAALAHGEAAEFFKNLGIPHTEAADKLRNNFSLVQWQKDMILLD